MSKRGTVYQSYRRGDIPVAVPYDNEKSADNFAKGLMQDGWEDVEVKEEDGKWVVKGRKPLLKIRR